MALTDETAGTAGEKARVLVTGSAGFIGYHLSELLLAEGFTVHGIDALTDYYDVTLKEKRHAHLQRHRVSARPSPASRMPPS